MLKDKLARFQRNETSKQTMKEHLFPPVEGPSEEETSSAVKAIARAFGEDWLESASSIKHPIKQLWNRDDTLVAIELISLGKAIQDLENIDKKWLNKRIEDIKRDPNTYHGYMFEIMSISMMSMGSMRVKPSRESTPGVDAIVNFDDGYEIAVSIKNHDMSEHERFFQERCQIARRKATAHLGKLSRSATVTIDIKEALTTQEWERVEGAIEKFQSVSMTNNIIDVAKGKATICIYPLDAHPGFQRFSPHHFSDTFLTISTQHRNEQLNFKSKVMKAAKNLAKHRTPSSNSANVIILKTHASADINDLTRYATELLRTDVSLVGISAIILYQTQVVKYNGQPVIAHHTQTALFNDSALKGHVINMSPMFGVTSEAPPKNLLTSADHEPFDLNGRYVFQAGDHYYLADDTLDGKQASVAYLGPGMVAHSVILDGDTIVLLRGKFPKNENLVVL